MRSVFTIILFFILGLCISCGPETDLPPRPPVPDPGVVRRNGGCTDQRFLDAEWAAYQALLQAREEAAGILKTEIDRLEKIYNADKARLNTDYLNDLKKCGDNSTCSLGAKDTYDKWIEKAQVYLDDGIYVAQGNELAAREKAQQEYEAAVKDARKKYCKGGYRASGKTADMTYSGTICDLEGPFTVNGSVINYKFNFTPASSIAGKVEIIANGMRVTADGGGTYTIEGLETGKPRIAVNASVTGHSPVGSKTGVGTVYIDLTPIEGECK